jgi:predicted phosphodiesterase
MRVAVVSDTHGNLAALEAVLADAAQAGAETLWNLGDAVDYGPQANETMALLEEHGSVHLAGNHDLVLNERLPLEDFSKLAQTCVHYS